MNPATDQRHVKIFADGADLAGIRALAADPAIRGFTTNPTLMRQAGVTDYERFAREALEIVGGRPISFEVFSDDFDEMERQARRIAAWGPNVYVKIPVTDTTGESSAPLIKRLAAAGVRQNVTALFTLDQTMTVQGALQDGPPACISIFAGRVADTGVDPVPLMREAVDLLRDTPGIELIWASPREVLNIVQADQVGCHIITVTHDLLRKLDGLGRDLGEFSLDTVRMFHRDAGAAGYQLGPTSARLETAPVPGPLPEPEPEPGRSIAFGQDHDPSPLDRLGRWLSTRRIRRELGPVAGRTMADIGCGYHADFARRELSGAQRLLLLDIALDPGLRAWPRTDVVEGRLPDALADVADASLDGIVCNNVLEHVWEAEVVLADLHRTLRPGGVLILNVPSWRGKQVLELASFNLGLAPEREMNDHKAYYDPRDLWPLLVRAGFEPRAIRCRRHKFGVNTIARCVKD